MLMNLRNALMAGKLLPYDAEVEYLESTGMQWIDTGVIANGEFDVEYTIQTPSSTDFTLQFMVGGARSASQHLNFGQYEPNGRFTLGFLGNYWVVATSVIAANTLYTVKIHYAYGSQTATINGANATSQTLTGTEALNLNIYLFKRNFYGASDTIPPMKGRMYAFKYGRTASSSATSSPCASGRSATCTTACRASSSATRARATSSTGWTSCPWSTSRATRRSTSTLAQSPTTLQESR